MGKIKEADGMYVPFVLDLDLWKKGKGKPTGKCAPSMGRRGGGVDSPVATSGDRGGVWRFNGQTEAEKGAGPLAKSRTRRSWTPLLM